MFVAEKARVATVESARSQGNISKIFRKNLRKGHRLHYSRAEMAADADISVGPKGKNSIFIFL